MVRMSARRVLPALGALMVVAVTVAVISASDPADRSPSESVSLTEPTARADATQSTEPREIESPRRPKRLRGGDVGGGHEAGSCTTAERPFRPRSIAIADVTTGARVIAPPRDSRGVPGIPPLTTAGKSLFAWDRASGVWPGDPAGNVLLNAHTWPEGSAIGNRMLAEVHEGDGIVVRGEHARLCYRVTERVEVPAEEGLPRYYTTDGPHQLAIVVCSGRRLAPGVWENRTVWFASPVGGRRPAEAGLLG